jgi:hypothetical protein
MSDAADERPPKRITVTVPCELAEKIEKRRKLKRRKFGPMLVRLAEIGLDEREKAERKKENDDA